MPNCAVVRTEDNVVDNKIVAEPTDLAPLNTHLVLIPDGMPCDIGWVWNGAEFVDPNPPAEDPTEDN